MVARESDCPVCCLIRSRPRRIAESIPSARQSTLRMPSASRSSLSHCDNGAAGHAGIFDRHDFAQRQPGQNHAADMLRQVAGKAEDLADEMDQLTTEAAGRVEARFGQAEEQFVAVVGMTDHIGERVDPIQRQAQRLANVPHGGTRPVGDELGRHPGPLAAILFVDILNHLFPALVLEVDIDVRGFGPILGNEPLEEDVDPIRVDGRDPQAITDGRVGRRAASLAEDARARAKRTRSQTVRK